jgi:hypothetical protein
MADPTAIPRFHGYRPPGGADFEGARTQFQTGFGQLDISLAAASTSYPGNSNGVVIVPVAGDFLYVDTDPLVSNGVVTLQFNVQQDAGGAKFYAQPAAWWNTTFKQLALSWAAQPGKSIRLIYSTGDRAGLAASIVQTLVTDSGINYGVSFRSSAALPVITPENVWAAASNVNGVSVWQAEGLNFNTTGMALMTFLCKATPPSVLSDGVIVAQSTSLNNFTANFSATAQMQRATNIPAGLRGDWIVGVNGDVTGFRSVLYTLK